MKTTTSVLPLVLLFASIGFTQATGSRPIPAGVRQADQQQDQFDRDSVPPLYQTSRVDLNKLKHDADELVELSKSVPGDIDQTTKGMLPKDLDRKLKRIEQLAKQLRSHLSH